ncbi:MAG: hypothetical protein KatS3mg057_2455 [Herpetosiphonaceae bacterium]|nr:MAG: hypothetical protein KatS3mg057_2455 [Herpetosiphonaceae bacterium]
MIIDKPTAFNEWMVTKIRFKSPCASVVEMAEIFYEV